MTSSIRDDQYRGLLELRTGVREFIFWSEEQAREHGVTPAQHQLLLAIRGHEGSDGPTVSDLAHVLLLRHHSVVGLIDRAQDAGLVERHRDTHSGALVRLTLTPDGSRRLAALTELHIRHLAEIAPPMARLWKAAGHLTERDAPAGAR
jgi:DNA-binding MarR family transcriptional regulator